MLPAGRVIAIDAGSHEVKVVLAQLFLNRVTIVKRETIAVPASPAEKESGATEFLANGFATRSNANIAQSTQSGPH